MDMLDANNLLTTMTQAPKDLNLGRIGPHQRAAADPKATTRRSDVKAPSQLGENGRSGGVRTSHLDDERRLNFVLRRCGPDHSKSSIICVFEIVPNGERAATCNCNSEALTKSLDVVPSALLSRRHQSLLSPSGGWVYAT